MNHRIIRACWRVISIHDKSIRILCGPLQIPFLIIDKDYGHRLPSVQLTSELSHTRSNLTCYLTESFESAAAQSTAKRPGEPPGPALRARWVYWWRLRGARERHFVDFSGTYHVISSPHFDDEYLYLTGTPYVSLRQDDNGRIEGEYQIGVQSGTINGGAHSDFFDFDFEGNDEMEDAFGEGEATLEGERLIFELRQYHGDEYTFVCERRG